MLKCPGCGGEMQYDTKEHKVKCKYCGSLFEVHELTEKYKQAKAEKEQIDEMNSYEGKAYKCTECGATLLSFDDTAITFCSYCGSQAMLEDKMMKQNNPDVVIPFEKSKEECISAYKKKIAKFMFAPDYMKSKITLDKFRGIYMPYGIYDLKYQGDANMKGSKYAYRRGDYQYYKDYMITAHDVDISYVGVSFDLVSKFYDNFSTSIPFRVNDAIPFDVAYMAGYYADCLDVKTVTYNYMATQVVLPDEKRRLLWRREFLKYGCTSPSINLMPHPRIGMFPVYFLAVRNEKNDAVHYAVVNGQTGEVAIEIPIDFKKYLGLSLFIASIAFIILNLSFTIKPNTALQFSIIASILCFLTSKKQLSEIEKKRTHQDDKGYESVHHEEKDAATKWEKSKSVATGKAFAFGLLSCFLCSICAMPILSEMPIQLKLKMGTGMGVMVFIFFEIGVYYLARNLMLKKLKLDAMQERKRYKETYSKEAFWEKGWEEEQEEEKMKRRFLRKEILAIVISAIVMIMGEAEDMFYYGAIIVSLILILLSFSDLVKEHNMLVSNKLPQLEKRGGDENG